MNNLIKLGNDDENLDSAISAVLDELGKMLYIPFKEKPHWAPFREDLLKASDNYSKRGFDTVCLIGNGAVYDQSITKIMTQKLEHNYMDWVLKLAYDRRLKNKHLQYLTLIYPHLSSTLDSKIKNLLLSGDDKDWHIVNDSTFNADFVAKSSWEKLRVLIPESEANLCKLCNICDTTDSELNPFPDGLSENNIYFSLNWCNSANKLPYLINLHGTCKDTKTIVLPTEEIILANEQRLMTPLRLFEGIILNCSKLYLWGCSLSDYDIEIQYYIFHALKHNIKTETIEVVIINTDDNMELKVKRLMELYGVDQNKIKVISQKVSAI